MLDLLHEHVSMNSHERMHNTLHVKFTALPACSPCRSRVPSLPIISKMTTGARKALGYANPLFLCFQLLTEKLTAEQLGEVNRRASRHSGQRLRLVLGLHVDSIRNEMRLLLRWWWLSTVTACYRRKTFHQK